ncbi:hypothetical protein MPTK1_3g12310 [Marchantia polymorpha subsp. ruderalis]|uniref:Secreted protein n=1 Tax=Marchantia polymorpha subsp. ruderalis TaxID=1480154 RepID=A0AAF6B016_MARPO|nr:hypothetical protein Mp_3g12310 [Marchantia polymorpha subsp. ruderalis]
MLLPSAILTVFQFMQCCLMPADDSSYPVSPIAYSRLHTPQGGAAGAGSMQQQDLELRNCVTLRPCPLFAVDCDAGPTTDHEHPEAA